MKQITILTKELHGLRITCTINRTYIHDGMIYYDEKDNKFFILQNKMLGAHCKNYDYKEYKLSRYVSVNPLRDNVRDIFPKYQIYELW